MTVKLCQWSGALYLDGLDHYVKRVLKVPGYLRYMDDFTLFHDDPAALLCAREAIGAWLARERGLQLNPRRSTVHPTAEPCTFLGYRISRGGLAPGKKVRKRLALRVPAAAQRGPAALMRTLQSYQAVFLF